MTVVVNGQQILTDDEGFIADQSQWNCDVALAIATQENIIALTDAHWEVINILRQFYQDTQMTLSNRHFVKMVAKTLGTEKGNSIYLLTLFPQSPAKLAAKIAGLPKPENCL